MPYTYTGFIANNVRKHQDFWRDIIVFSKIFWLENILFSRHQYENDTIFKDRKRASFLNFSFKCNDGQFGTNTGIEK